MCGIRQLLRLDRGLHMLRDSWIGGNVRELNMSIEAASKEVEAEHALLGKKLADVVHLCPERDIRKDCRDCPHAHPVECSLALQDMVGDLLAYMVTHFRHEESLMRRWGLIDACKDMCDRHMEDHGDISEAFGELAAALQGDNPLPRVQDIHSLLQGWLSHHIEEHDQPMLKNLVRL